MDKSEYSSLLRDVSPYLPLHEQLLERGYRLYLASTPSSRTKLSARVRVASTFYLACRLEGYAVVIDDLRTGEITRTQLGACYRQLLLELNVVVPPPAVDVFLERVCSSINLSSSVRIRARSLADKVRDSHIAEMKKPLALAAAITFVACALEGVSIEKVALAHIASTSSSTLSGAIELVRKVLNADDSRASLNFTRRQARAVRSD
jgi:transcription initiation factor TFIIIB Brf1 subunit/transcription initiation factor TFIIB